MFSLQTQIRVLKVSQAIRGGYVPDKSQTVNTKTALLIKLIQLKVAVFPRYSWFLRTPIVKTVNSEGRLYRDVI